MQGKYNEEFILNVTNLIRR